MGADVYAGDAEGCAGWSWYTGAAGWYLRTALEDLLGLKLRGGNLYLEPCLPQNWLGSTIRWQDGSGTMHTIVFGRDAVTADGKPYDGSPVGTIRKAE